MDAAAADDLAAARYRVDESGAVACGGGGLRRATWKSASDAADAADGTSYTVWEFGWEVVSRYEYDGHVR